MMLSQLPQMTFRPLFCFVFVFCFVLLLVCGQVVAECDPFHLTPQQPNTDTRFLQLWDENGIVILELGCSIHPRLGLPQDGDIWMVGAFFGLINLSQPAKNDSKTAQKAIPTKEHNYCC